MREWLVVAVLFSGFTVIVAAQQTTSRPAPHRAASTQAPDLAAFKAAAKKFEADGCDEELWHHVYHPKRLVVVDKCIAVAGTIRHEKKEADGDDHVQLTVDTEYADLLNDRNKTAQNDSLILEPICQNAVTQSDAIAACRDFHSDVTVPQKGVHVRVTGSYVFDSETPGHGWMEIHPVTSIESTQ